MAEKNFNTRIIHKHDTEANWLKAENFIPKKGELIVYDKDVNYNYSRFKIGDGETFVNNLPFSTKQSDWNQTVETQVDYIKNRPIYGPYETETVKVSEITVTTNESEVLENIYAHFVNLKDYAFEFNISMNTYYKINFNGTDYICKPWSGYTIYLVGNQSISSEYTVDDYVFDNGQPFLFVSNWSGTWLTLYTKTAGEYTFSITEVTIDRKCLDRELLPFGYETNPDNNGAVILNGGMGVWSLGGGDVGSFSVSEGESVASGNDAHAEGFVTFATGEGSHSEGRGTFAEGDWSHAEGDGTIASGWRSHAEGCSTKASSTEQHVQGRYNIEDTNNVYAHIVGNGDNQTPSNAHTLDWDGNAWFAGNITLGGNNTKVLSEADYITNEEIDEICNSYAAAREVLF